MTTPVANIVVAPNTPLVVAPGVSYSINSVGQIVNPNGTVDTRTSRVDVLGFTVVNGVNTLWQKNASNDWYSEPVGGTVWTPFTTGGVPPGLHTGFLPGFFDKAMNNWIITPNHQITVDGVISANSANVTQLFVPPTGGIWQENASDNWYFQATPASAWTPGTFVNPATGKAPAIWKGGKGLASAPGNWTNGALAPNEALVMNGGEMDIGSTGLDGDVLTIQPTTAAVPKIDMNGGEVTVQFASDAINPSQNLDINLGPGIPSLGNGTSTLNLPNVQIGILTVTAQPNSVFCLIGNFSAGAAPMQFIQHGGTFEFDSDIKPSLAPGFPSPFGNTILIDGNLRGNSPIEFTGNKATGGDGNITITGSISATSGVFSYANGPGSSGVILGNAKADAGSITLINGAFLEEKGETSAASYTYDGTKLNVLDNLGKLLSSVKLTSESFTATLGNAATAQSTPISVGKDAAGDVFAYQSGFAGSLATDHHLTNIPLHG